MSKLNRVYGILAIALALVLLLSAGAWHIANANVGQSQLTEDPPPAPTVGSMELSQGWALKSANLVTDGGATISQVGYNVSSWYPITIPSTVMAGLVANGVYTSTEWLFMGTNLRTVPSLTGQNWWYRGEFTAPTNPGGQYWLRFKRIAYKAEIWLNGTRLDANAEGTLVVHEYNVTNLINPGGANAIAVRVTPPVGSTNLSYWYVDWNQAPPDMSAGISDKVLLDMSGPVELRDPYVKTVLPLPATNSADLTVYVDAENGTASPVDGVLQAVITKAGYPTITVEQPVTLAANERREITFNPTTFTDLHVTNPALWWPFAMGSPELYDLNVSFQVGGQPSASQSIKFGIRQVTQYHTKSMYGTSYFQGFQVNGKSFLVRGGAYVWDIFMRWDTPTNEAHMKYAKDMGLNTIRFEGILGNEEIYDIADREGIMLMPGFVCCSRWESWSSWTASEVNVAYASLQSQMRLMRAHASALVWLYGSDGPPTNSSPYYILNNYKAIAANLHWQNATVDSAASDGIKMNGPYKWEPPVYWYWDTVRGGAWGICAEEGGETPPPVESLQKFIPANQLWPMTFGSTSNPNAYSYHLGTSSTFNNITFYNTGLNQRYITPTNIISYSDKSQLQNYEAARGQFEAFGANAYDPATQVLSATGTIYWMMNNAWPTLHWNLYDYYMKPAGSYFGAKKANEPVHVLWDYNSKKVKVYNSTLTNYTGMQVSAAIYNIPDLTQKYTNQVILNVPADLSTTAFTIPSISGLSTTYFVRLQLRDSSGKLVSDNVYWYSTRPDIMSSSGNWYQTSISQYANFSGLNSLPTNNSVTASASGAVNDGQETATITLNNPSTTNVAFFVHVEVTKGQGGEEAVPLTYTDNYITLWPGESTTIIAKYATANLGGQPAYVRVRGYNVPEFSTVVNYISVSNSLASQSVQYTDRIQTVTIAATDIAAYLPLSASTQWALDGGTFQPGLPSWLTLTPLPCTVDGTYGTCAWTLEGIGTVPVKSDTYVVRTTVSDGLASRDTDVTIMVMPEDAYIQYTGETIAQIGTNLTLRATVWDSAASGYLGANPETGPNATIGDLTKMWIAFDLYPVGSCLSDTPTTKYAQVSDTGTAGDGIGTASTTFTSASEAGYCVVARLVAGSSGGANQWYTADNAEVAAVTFYENTGQFATGGGWIDDPGGSKGNFGFNARYNKKGQPQGHMVYVYRGSYNGVPADFIIRSNALNALAFGGKTYPIPATLQGKCTIQINRSSDGALLYSDGNAAFQATATDSGQSSGIGSDSFSLTVYDKNGVVYKSVPVTLLQGGNVVVHQ